YLGRPRAWEEALAALRAALAKLRIRRGAGLRVLTEVVSSPTLADQLAGEREDSLRKQLPEAKWYQYEPAFSDAALEGLRLATGSPLQPVYDFTKADVVLSLDADFLGCGPAHLRYVRDFIGKRRVRDKAGPVTMNRLYVVECTPTRTGAVADH